METRKVSTCTAMVAQLEGLVTIQPAASHECWHFRNSCRKSYSYQCTCIVSSALLIDLVMVARKVLRFAIKSEKEKVVSITTYSMDKLHRLAGSWCVWIPFNFDHTLKVSHINTFSLSLSLSTVSIGLRCTCSSRLTHSLSLSLSLSLVSIHASTSPYSS